MFQIHLWAEALRFHGERHLRRRDFILRSSNLVKRAKTNKLLKFYFPRLIASPGRVDDDDCDWTTLQKICLTRCIQHRFCHTTDHDCRWMEKNAYVIAHFSSILSPFVSISMSKCSLKFFHQRLKLVSNIIEYFFIFVSLFFYLRAAKFIYHSRLHLLALRRAWFT